MSVVLVTGGSRGIGEATAQRFIDAGDEVAILARPSQRLNETAQRLGALAIPCDLSPGDMLEARVEAAVTTIQGSLGAVEILVNNAGVASRGPASDYPLHVWRQTLATNLTAPFLFARAVLPHMLARGAGRIVNVSSISGTLGTAEMTAYCASKWGLIGLTKALSEEVKGRGVVVTAICPGSVDTQMLVGSGFDPDMSPKEVADAIYFLATGPAPITGACLHMFG